MYCFSRFQSFFRVLPCSSRGRTKLPRVPGGEIMLIDGRGDWTSGSRIRASHGTYRKNQLPGCPMFSVILLGSIRLFLRNAMAESHSVTSEPHSMRYKASAKPESLSLRMPYGCGMRSRRILFSGIIHSFHCHARRIAVLAFWGWGENSARKSDCS